MDFCFTASGFTTMWDCGQSCQRFPRVQRGADLDTLTPSQRQQDNGSSSFAGCWGWNMESRFTSLSTSMIPEASCMLQPLPSDGFIHWRFLTGEDLHHDCLHLESSTRSMSQSTVGILQRGFWLVRPDGGGVLAWLSNCAQVDWGAVEDWDTTICG